MEPLFIKWDFTLLDNNEEIQTVDKESPYYIPPLKTLDDAIIYTLGFNLGI